VLWSLLLVGLLALLPCAGTAKAASGPLPVPGTTAATTAPHAAGPTAVSRQDHRHRAQGQHRDDSPIIWCSAESDRPLPGSCASHAFCGPEAQLPNAPPQPAGVTQPQLIAVRALPCGRPIGDLAGPDHAPDLHLLQVHRT
jgi:hypothetical protein